MDGYTDNDAGAAPPQPTLAPRHARPASLRWWLLPIGCGLIVAASVADGAVTGGLGSDPVRHWLELLMGVPLAIGPYLIILAILVSFPNRWRLCAGFLTPVLASTAMLHVLKWAVGRGRPMLGQGPYHFAPFTGAELCDSFPSGHAAAAGTVALLLGLYFRRGRGVFYFLAGLIGLERIVTHWHYLSDVLAGYGLAALVVLGSVRWLGESFYRKDWSPGESAATRTTHTTS